MNWGSAYLPKKILLAVSQALRVLCLVVSLILLCGCDLFSSNIESDIEEYSTRLERVLSIRADNLAETSLSDYPPKRELYQDVASVDINLTEFYTLQQCELGTLVAERNTVLGKQRDVAARFHYETQIAKALGDCSRLVEQSDPALAMMLMEWQETKLSQRKNHWANLIQTSNEIQLAMTLSPHFIQQEQNNDALAAINALGYLSQLDTEPHGSLASLNRQLKILESSRLPAKIWRTQQTITAGLNSLTPALARTFNNINCQKDSETVTIARNVFYLYFIERVQPVGSVINNFHYKMSDAMERLLLADALDNRYKNFLQKHHQDGFEAYQLALKNHVEVWQGMLSQCGLSPTKP